MPNQLEYRNIAEYMKAFDRMFLFLPDKVADEHKREIELHLRQLAQQSLLAGMTEEEAERQAIATFGPPREVASPLVMRWLKKAEHPTAEPVKKRQYLACFITIGLMPGSASFLPYASPRPVQVIIALASGLIAGVVTVYAMSSPASDYDMPEETAKIAEGLAEEWRNHRPQFKGGLVRRIDRELSFGILRWAINTFDERKRHSLKGIFNLKFFLAYGTAFLFANLLPTKGARMLDFVLADWMALSIASAFRLHFTQQSKA